MGRDMEIFFIRARGTESLFCLLVFPFLVSIILCGKVEVDKTVFRLDFFFVFFYERLLRFLQNPCLRQGVFLTDT